MAWILQTTASDLTRISVAKTYRFHQTFQKQSESVTEYANELKKLAVNCNFRQYLQGVQEVNLWGAFEAEAQRETFFEEQDI